MSHYVSETVTVYVLVEVKQLAASVRELAQAVTVKVFEYIESLEAVMAPEVGSHVIVPPEPDDAVSVME